MCSTHQIEHLHPCIVFLGEGSCKLFYRNGHRTLEGWLLDIRIVRGLQYCLPVTVYIAELLMLFMAPMAYGADVVHLTLCELKCEYECEYKLMHVEGSGYIVFQEQLIVWWCYIGP